MDSSFPIYFPPLDGWQHIQRARGQGLTAGAGRPIERASCGPNGPLARRGSHRPLRVGLVMAFELSCSFPLRSPRVKILPPRPEDARDECALTSIPGAVIQLRPELLWPVLTTRDLGRCQQLSSGPRADFNQLGLPDHRNLTRCFQVTTMPPPQLSDFAPGFSVASVPEDSLRLGRLPWSAVRRTARRPLAGFPGVEANAPARPRRRVPPPDLVSPRPARPKSVP
jgi:hypothetical protein